jgi:hypothetical protein
MYDFFSLLVVHINNREQFLVTFSYIFKDFRQMGAGGIIFNSTTFLSPFCVCETGPEEHKSVKRVSIMNWVGMGGGDSTARLENLPNKHILQKNPGNTEECAGDI